MTDVAGLKVGHFTDARRPTGCTVVLCEAGAVAGVDVRGAAPGTRETDLLNPLNSVEKVHAVLLTGGSAFGLDAASGVMMWLEERGHGLSVGPARIPIAPAAVLFDLWLGDAKIRPDAAAGYAAANAANSSPPAQGNVGAGAGACIGKLFGPDKAMKGGIGSASLTVGAVTVGALVAVNAAGDVVHPTTGQVLAGARGEDGQPLNAAQAIAAGRAPAGLMNGMSTTIGVIATDAKLSKAQCCKLAGMAHNGLARTISPVHTPLDGDTLFALSTGQAGVVGNLLVLGVMAAEVTARAVLNAVSAAQGLALPGQPFLPAAQDLMRASIGQTANGTSLR
jgi:L-aminopeptidase/D-esterase-like protein